MNTDLAVTIGVSVAWGSMLAAGGYCLSGSSIYDTRWARSAKAIVKHPHSRKLRIRPLISVIIVANNSQQTLEGCLESIVKNGYRKYEIIVVDNRSLDGSKKVVKAFAKNKPKKAIKLVGKRRGAGYDAALHLGLKKSKGSVVLLLDPRRMLAKTAIKDAVSYLHYTGADVCLANSLTVKGQNLTSLADFTKDILFDTPAAKAMLTIGNSGIRQNSVYEQANLSALLSSNQRTHPLVNIIVFRLLAASWTALLVYLSYIAAAHDYPQLLGLLVLTVLTYTLLTIMSDVRLDLKIKLKTLATLPGSLTLVYIESVFRASKTTLSLAGQLAKK